MNTKDTDTDSGATDTTDTNTTDTGTRRQAGGGSIDLRPSGRWRVRLTFSDGSRKNAGMFDTEEEAQRFLDAALVVQAEEKIAPTGGITLATWGVKWLNRREDSGNHRAIGSERSTWKHHISTAPFADWPLGNITRRDVKDWVATLSRKKALAPAAWKKAAPTKTTRTLSRQSVVHALNLLRKCLADAIEDELLRDNPAKDVTIPNNGTTEEGWTFLTPEEITTVTTCPKLPREARLLYAVAIYTGLRQGELWGLHWTDVHLDGPQPKVVVRYSHKGPTKSGKIRHVPLLPQAIDALRDWQAMHPKRTAALVFPTVTGCRRAKSDEAGWRDRHITKTEIEPGHKTLAGITRRVRFHDLRHTCASHLIMGTWGRAWRLEEVSAFLGHSEVGVTQRYAHLSADHLHRAASETVGPVVAVKNPVQGPAKVPSGGKTGGGTDTQPLEIIEEKRARRIELPTFSLGSATVTRETNGVFAPRDLHGTVASARAFLAALAGGQPADELAVALADAVLDNDLIRLALDVRAGGPHGFAKAVQLAGAVLTAERAGTATKGGKVG